MASNPQDHLKGHEKDLGARADEGKQAPVQVDLKGYLPASSSARQLGSILEEAGLVNEEMVRNLIRDSNEDAQSVQRSLVSTGLVREDDILAALAEEMHLEQISFDDIDITPELIAQIDAKIAKKYKVFPVRYTDEAIWVALGDPLDIQTTDSLKMALSKEVFGCVAPEEDITKALRRYYEGDEIQSIYEKTLEEQDEGGQEKGAGFRDYTKLDLDAEDDDQETPAAVKFVDLIFKQAVHEKASDIHIEPTRHGLDIRFRVDGVLHHIPSQPPKKWQNQILARLKVQANMDLAEKRVPQDGRIALVIDGKSLDLRVSCLPSFFGETIVMRILDQANVSIGLEDVGFLPDSIKRFQRLIRTPDGIILMTGPTGSGKTTTLYAALGTLNNIETKIITVENPVEYQIAGLNQVQVDEEVGLDFSTALRTILRQSPDIILVGEIRDLETAEIAIRAALTGHLVFSTLHTNDAPSASIRLVDMGIKPYLVGSSLSAVIAQRLVRSICPYCKASYSPKPGELVEMDEDPEKAGEILFYKGSGCDRCNDLGYRGRTAIHEIMELDAELRRMIINQAAAEKLKAAALPKGMRTLRMDGYEKIRLGLTSFEEVMRITQQDDMAPS